MSIPTNSIWREVSGWPADERLALATFLLKSLGKEDSASVSIDRQKALRELIGIWKTEQPLDDQQVEEIVDRERMKRQTER